MFASSLKLLFRSAPHRRYNSNLLQKVETAVLSQAIPSTRALQLFYACKEQCDNDHWFKDALIPNNFHGKHGILLLHIWMVNRRLVQLPESTSRIETQEALFDTFWMDTQSRIRAAGIAEISVNARLKDVQDWSIPTMLELDHAMTFLTDKTKESLNKKERELEVIEGFCSTLWRQIYQRGEMLSEDYIRNGSSITTFDEDNIITSNENASSEQEVHKNEIETLEMEVALKPEHETIITNLAKYLFYEYDSLQKDISDIDYQNVMFRFGEIPTNFKGSNNTTIEKSRTNPNRYDTNIVRNIEFQKMIKENPDENHVSYWRSTMHVDGKIYYW